jgi:hypothetical protein
MPTEQWAAVRTVCAFSNVPPQDRSPPSDRETRKGNSEIEAEVPPTIPESSPPRARRFVAGVVSGDALEAASIENAAKRVKIGAMAKREIVIRVD